MKHRRLIRRRDGIIQSYWKNVSRPKYVKTFKQDGVIAEPKYDGSRTLLGIKGNQHEFINRRGFKKTEIYPELDSITKNVNGDAIIDGEIVALDKQHPYGNFDKLARRDRLVDKEKIRTRSKIMPLTYVAFDILNKQGKDVTKLPLLERKKLLDQTIKQSNKIKEIEYSNKPEELLKKVKKNNGEGIVIKKSNSIYTPGKSRAWEKFKILNENDVAIVGATKGIGKRKSYFGALKMGLWTGKDFKDVGKVGTGFTDFDLKEISYKLKKKEPLVARVKYQKIGSQGRLFGPKFIAIRNDITQKQTHELK